MIFNLRIFLDMKAETKQLLYNRFHIVRSFPYHTEDV